MLEYILSVVAIILFHLAMWFMLRRLGFAIFVPSWFRRDKVKTQRKVYAGAVRYSLAGKGWSIAWTIPRSPSPNSRSTH